MAADQQLFDLGQIVATPGAVEAMATHDIDAGALLTRHMSGDWGELDREDVRTNNDAVVTGQRILSNYPVAKGVEIWVITEWDRSVTTLLLPDEY